jgi:DNA mismatch repair protein MutS
MPEYGGDGFEYMASAARVCEQFSASDVDALGMGELPAAVCACGALLKYIADTQKFDMGHIDRLNLYSGGRYMETGLDHPPQSGADGVPALRRKARQPAVGAGQDQTPMGGRLLRAWVERPLLSPVAIKRRLSAVNELYNDNVRARSSGRL